MSCAGVDERTGAARAFVSVNLLDITVLNPDGAPFTSGFSFQVTFECVAPLAGELEWRVVYVGSARSEAHDQELDSVLVGPVMLGVSRFVLDVPAPNPAKIPAEDLLGATAIMITCSYKGKEFVKVGYWVSNSPKNPPAEGEEPPTTCAPEDIVRSVLAAAPRVTRWPIDWS